jgi:hypothetical protein
MELKTYLKKFFDIYEYDKKDAQILTDVYVKITENEDTSKLFEQIMKMYEEDINCDYKQIIEIADKIAEKLYIHEFTVELLVFICLSEKTEKVYAEKGIAPEVFYGNMCDLKYKLEECKLVYNITGSFVAQWFERFFNATRFTFGRLQFELIDFNKNYEKNGVVLTPESRVVNVHIPRSPLPFNEENCDKAFLMAAEFFKDEFEESIPFYCASWLLYPENKEILSEKSNTYKFLSRFDIIKGRIDKTFHSLWRIFDTMEKHPDRLPEDTRIKKAYKEHLKRGGKIGSGEGLFFISKENLKKQ